MTLFEDFIAVVFSVTPEYEGFLLKEIRPSESVFQTACGGL
ncbi:hypothetical protein [Neisseria dumasiana]|nr:hypothetical protein [Neisseria dumasiana]